MFARVVVLGVLVVGCVDLSRPEVLLVDGPVAPGQDARDAAPDRDADSPDSPGPDVPVDGEEDGSPEDAEPEAGDPDGGEPDMPPADLMPAPPLVANGQPCSAGTQCASGICADGLCCNQACDGLCFACNLAGAPGTCTAVPTGNDPRGQCAQTAAATCGLDGSCNGAGACRNYPDGTECVPGTCSGSVESAARTCDGAGSCRPVVASRSCSPGVCMGSSCATTCSQQDQCLTGFFCDGTRCAGKRANGAACTMAFQCTSSYCVDGYCCNSQCGDTCNACNIAGQLGSCTAVPDGQDPRTQCPADATGGCGNAGGCNGAGACRLKAAGTACVATSCSGGVETGGGACNGLQVCSPTYVRGCGAYVCAGAACATTCTTNDQCQAGFQCNAPSCVRIPGLALFWRFEEGAPTAAVIDSSGNNNTGTYVGPPVPSAILPPLTYPNSASRAFTQSARHAVAMADAPATLKPANELTLSIWFKTSAVDQNGGVPIGSELISLSNNYILRLRPDGVETSKRTSGGAIQCRSQAQPGVFNDGWHHLAAVFGASEGVKLYLDGTAQTCQVASAASNTASIIYGGASDNLWVGRHGDEETQWDFGGNLDEVRIYNRALNAAEVLALSQGRNAP